MSGLAPLLCKEKWRVQTAVTPAMACASAASLAGQESTRLFWSLMCVGIWRLMCAAVSPTEMVTVRIHLTVQLNTNVTKMDQWLSVPWLQLNDGRWPSTHMFPQSLFLQNVAFQMPPERWWWQLHVKHCKWQSIQQISSSPWKSISFKICVPNSGSTNLKVFPDSAAEWKYPLENRMLPTVQPTPFSFLEVIHVPSQLVKAMSSSVSMNSWGRRRNTEIKNQQKCDCDRNLPNKMSNQLSFGVGQAGFAPSWGQYGWTWGLGLRGTDWTTSGQILTWDYELLLPSAWGLDYQDNGDCKVGGNQCCLVLGLGWGRGLGHHVGWKLSVYGWEASSLTICISFKLKSSTEFWRSIRITWVSWCLWVFPCTKYGPENIWVFIKTNYSCRNQWNIFFPKSYSNSALLTKRSGQSQSSLSVSQWALFEQTDLLFTLSCVCGHGFGLFPSRLMGTAPGHWVQSCFTTSSFIAHS